MTRTFTAIVLTAIALFSVAANAQTTAEKSDDKDDAIATARLEYLLNRLRTEQFRPATRPNAMYRLQDTPIFRWQNNISGADGAVFLWTLDGRPVLLTKAHVNEQRSIFVESASPLAEDKFEMTANGQLLWAPSTPAVSRMVMEGAAPPADQKAARLTQMRAIARRFRFNSLWGEENPSDWELRLLPTPLHRFSSDEAHVIDGAIFGYAQGTNPETVVLVESVATDAGPRWEATPSRLTGYAVKGWLDEKLILDVPRANNTPVDSPFRHHYERLVPFPLPKTQK